MKQCLIVDDSDVIRKVARRILETMHYDVLEAENGQEALERCHARMPDAILLDCNMPVMNGIEFLGSLRQQPNGKRPLVFYCTTENDPIEIARALSAGADEYILKPYNRESIRAKFSDVGGA